MKLWGITDMSYTENIWLFFVLLLGIILVPGMDMLYVLTNALTGGRRAGLSATAEVQNLFDRKYQDAVGYPALGRNFRVGIKYVWGGKE